MSRIRLEIESELPNVCLIAMAVHRICTFCGMDDMDAYQVELCVSEAVTNAILHAYDSRPGHIVSLLVSIGQEGMLLECGDQGKAMSAEQVMRVTHESSVVDLQRKSLREGGRGLQIIRGIMDEVAYTTNGKSHCLRMAKRFKKS